MNVPVEILFLNICQYLTIISVLLSSSLAAAECKDGPKQQHMYHSMSQAGLEMFRPVL